MSTTTAPTYEAMVRRGREAAHDAVAVERGADRAVVTLHEVHPHDELLAAANAWCDRIAALPPHALAMTKPLLRACADASWDAALALEEFAEPSCFTTRAFADAVEGLRSGQS